MPKAADNVCSTTRKLGVAGLFLGLGIAPLAQAALGDTFSLERERQALGATTHSVIDNGQYVRHEFTDAKGANVREFVTSAGQVFAVSWQGRAMPDLGVLLGAHAKDYVAALGAPRRTINHHVLSFQNSEISLSVIKLPRGVAGSAQLNALTPNGAVVR